MSAIPLTGGDTFEGGYAALEVTEGQKNGVRLYDAENPPIDPKGWPVFGDRLSDGLPCCGAALLAFAFAEGPEVFK